MIKNKQLIYGGMIKMTLTFLLVLATMAIVQPVFAQVEELLPFRDEFNRTINYTSNHFAFGDKWFYLYGNKDKLGVKMENGYLDMTGYASSDGWQIPILRDDNSSYDGNWWWWGCNYQSVPGDPDTPLSALKAANLAPQANGHILNYEFKVLHNDLNGHFGFALGFGDNNQQRGGIGFETHQISQWGTTFRAYYGLHSQGHSVCQTPGHYDFGLPSFIDQPHTFRWQIDLTDPNYVTYKVYMDDVLRYSSAPHYLPTRDVIVFNLYQAAGFWSYPTSHSRYEYVHLWRDNERFLFSSFSPEIKIEIGNESNDDTLKAKGDFTLGQESDGINPINEVIKIKIGNFEATIPAGSFKWFAHPKKPEKSEWRFEGEINGGPVQMKIKPFGGNNYEFKFKAENLNLCWITNPIEVMLNIGDDFGRIEVSPEIEGDWASVCPQIQTPGISPDTPGISPD